jgi:hypothetical protein
VFSGTVSVLGKKARLGAVLRIRDDYPGSDFFPSRIPDPNCLHPGSRIRIKEIRILTKNGKYDPGCSSRIPDPDADFLPIPDPGVKKAIIPDPQHWFGVTKLKIHVQFSALIRILT